MAFSLEDIDAELARRQGTDHNPSLNEIDAELARRGVGSSQDQTQTTPPPSQDIPSYLYHGAIEGGAMAVGGAAGAVMGAPAGPVGSALGATALGAASYAPAKRVAEAIDKYRGITPPPQESVGQGFQQGLEAEALGRIAKPVLGVVGKGLARTGEALSGVPERDIRQLFNKPGTLWKLGSKDQAGAAIGEAKGLAGINPGVTNDVGTMTSENVGKALNVEVSGKDALNSVASGDRSPEKIGDALKYISDEIKGRLSQGKDASELINIQNHLNNFLDQAAPGVQAARQEFAPLAQRNKFLGLFPQNKNGSYSKANLFYLNSLLGTAGYAGGGASGATEAVLGGIAARAPITTGVITSALGGASKLLGNDLMKRALITQFVENRSRGSK